MNLTYIHLSSAVAQSIFIASLPTNKSYMKYYRERTTTKKLELDGVLQNCKHRHWQRMMMLIDLAKIFMKLTSYALVKMLH
jgi:ssDNA-specific exonuclease RecJ